MRYNQIRCYIIHPSDLDPTQPMENNTESAGYYEVAHTADWALRVWAPDLAGLFCQAAKGMSALLALNLQDVTRLQKEITLSADEIETLLVKFLSELVYELSQGAGYDGMEVQVVPSDEQFTLHAQVEFAPVNQLRKEIKAVTYHNLVIQQNAAGYQTTIVLDV